MRSVAAAALLVLAFTGTAAAQPGLTLPPPAPLPPPVLRGEQLSETTASWLAFGGTAASWTLIFVAADMNHAHGNASRVATIGAIGTVFAPSFGHWYADSFLTRGLGLRVLGIGFTVAALASLASAANCEDDCGDSSFGVLALAGAGLFIAGTIDDLATTPSAVRRHNQRLQSLAIAPVVHRGSTGLALTGRF
jgi:hypothetical protein